MSHNRQVMPQASTSSSRVSSVTRVNDVSSVGLSGTLRLRAEDDMPSSRDETPARRIRWSEDVIDNEGMGKKSSKVCCIYHKARPVGESSSESESSDSESSDSDSDGGLGSGSSRRRCQHPRCQHPRHQDEGHSPERSQESTERGRATCSRSHSNTKNKRRKPSPNAYEKMPKNTKE